MIACSESSIHNSGINGNPKIESRSAGLNELYFGSGISRTPYYNAVSDEYEYTIYSNFEIRPFGDENWYEYPVTTAMKIKVKCTCTGGCIVSISGCLEHLDDSGPIVASCENQCNADLVSQCPCKMKIRITSASNDILIAGYEGGADVQLIN